MLNETAQHERAEAQRRILEETRRTMDWWSEKHGGACPYCGSHDGMVGVYPYVIEESLFGRRFYRSPHRDDVLFCECWACNSDTSEYTPMTKEEVEEWLK